MPELDKSVAVNGWNGMLMGIPIFDKKEYSKDFMIDRKCSVPEKPGNKN